MKFLQKNPISIEKTFLVISDLHLGAGIIVNGKQNYLEDFFFDAEFVEFLDYFSSGEFESRPIELILNGDFLDFLAVPFTPFFDDEFWSEESALEKLRLIMKAHFGVMEGLVRFLTHPNKKITYILGNHDGEFAFDRLREEFANLFKDCPSGSFQFHLQSEYRPIQGAVIKHGHEYEMAHRYDLKDSIIVASNGEKYFLPSWGAYYVTRVINKFKRERSYINSVRPIKDFLIYGLIFDTLFTLRFMISNITYFLMVRILFFWKQKRGKIRECLQVIKEDLKLFYNSEDMRREFFHKNPKQCILIMGHTHGPAFKTYPDQTIFINTGTWTKMHGLDLAGNLNGFKLTYAQVDICGDNQFPSLKIWKGSRNLPYVEFH